MIYLNNNTEVQEIFIPKQEITAPANPKPTYENGFEDGKKVGYNEGREYQKDQLLNLYVTENGQYEREDGWGVVTVDVPAEGGDCSEAYDKGFEDGYNQGQAECPEGGDCNLGEGEIFLTTNDIGTYEMYASDEGYDGWSKFIVTLEGGGAIYVHKASELLDTFNNGGHIDYGAYYYVGGEITEIQEVNTQYGNATYILDNGFKVYRGKWVDGAAFTSEDQIKVGAYIVVYGVIANYNGTLQFNAGSQVIAYQECEGGEIVSCNLEDKWVTPSMGEMDENGYIVVEEDEGYDGLSRVVINPQTIYNEGVEAGRAEGGEGGSCNLGTLDMTLTDPYTVVKDASEDGYDGYSQVIVRPDAIIAQQREEAINEFKNKMGEITITENGVYSIDDTELVNSIAFDGNSYFNTGIVPTENIKIEVCIKVTDGNDSGMGGIIIGGGIAPVDSQNYYGDENRGIAIGMGGGAIYGVWGATRSWNNPYEYEKTTTVVLQKTDDSWGWEGEKGSFGASTLYIGGYNRNGEEVEEKFTQSIVYVKIWTNRNDDSTLITYTPNTNGNFDANGVELQRIGDGTTTYVEENMNIYPNGFKRVEVNVECVCPTAQEQAFEYDTTAFTYNVYDWTSANINRDNITNDCGDRPLDCLLLRNRNGECTVMTNLDNCSGTVRLVSEWNSGSIILSLISKTITEFSANAINSYQLKSIDTGFARLVGNAIMNCNSLTDIKVTILNNDLSNQFAVNCFNGLPTEGTITIDKNVDVTLTDDEITSFFRTIVGEGWTITIE